MNHRESPTTPLDAAEQALARIARALPAAEPSPALDRMILKSAQDAIARNPRRRHWLLASGSVGGAGTAAAAVLTIGIAWQWLQGPSMPYPPSPGPPAMQGVASEQERLQIELLNRPPPMPNAPPAPALRALSSAPLADAALRKPQTAKHEQTVALEPPPAFTDEHVPQSARVAAESAAPALSEQANTLAGAAAPQAEALAAPRGSAAKSREAVSQASQPLTVDAAALARAKSDARLAPRLWLRRIEQRLSAGDLAGARASAQLFRARYPEQILPKSLREQLGE